MRSTITIGNPLLLRPGRLLPHHRTLASSAGVFTCGLQPLRYSEQRLPNGNAGVDAATPTGVTRAADSEHTGMICNDAMDDLVVPHWEPHRIPIVAVRELTVPEARHLLAENHIRLPPGSKPAKGNQVATK